MVQGGDDDEEVEESDDEDVEEPGMGDLVFDVSKTVSRPKGKTLKKPGQPPKAPETSSDKSSDNELIRFLIAERRETREFNAKLLEKMERQSSITSAAVIQQAQTQKTPQKTQCLREPDMADESLWVSGQRVIEDNRVDKLDLRTRFQLGAIQSAPRLWYKHIPKELAQVTQPRRGSTVYVEHLIGQNRLHPTLCWE